MIAENLIDSCSLVIICRPYEYQKLERIEGVRTFQLDKLKNNDMKMVVESSFGSNSLPPNLVNAILQKSQGNPFFAEQLVASLKDQGIVKIAFGKVVVDPKLDPNSLKLPDTIQGAILSRVDRF